MQNALVVQGPTDVLVTLDTIQKALGHQSIVNPVSICISCLSDMEGFGDIHFGLVRMYVTPYRIFWIIFTSDLVISYTDKLFVFQ